MNNIDINLETPIYLKTQSEMAWPTQDKVFHLITADGLFICRNHSFFTSSVPARHWPSELATHEGFIELRYPKLSTSLLERVIGFFHIMAQRGAEAVVLLAYIQESQSVRVIVPQQVSTVSQGWNGHVYPIGVKFDLPRLLPPGWLLLGDIHSHADENAYSSYTDRSDEQYGAGLHVVVGRVLSREPPEFHIEVTADGTRFNISDRSHVFEGYNQRRQQVPRNWIEKVSIVPWESSYRSQKNANTNTYKYRYRKTTAKS